MFWRRRREVERELDRELRSHLESEAAEKRHEGLTEDAAWDEARRAFGNAGVVREDVRHVWGWVSVERLLQDLRYAIRSLWKYPVFSISSALALALGIGASTAIVTVVNRVMLQPLPYPDADQLVVIRHDYGAQGQSMIGTTPPTLAEYRAEGKSLEVAAVRLTAGAALAMASRDPDDRPEYVRVNMATENLFPLLGVRPLLGRNFTNGEAVVNGPRVVMLSYGLWKRRFGAEAGMIGKAIQLDGEPWTVIGILPEGFDLKLPITFSSAADLWKPAQIDPNGPLKAYSVYVGVGRIRPGANLARAQAEFDRLAEKVRSENPDEAGMTVKLLPFHNELIKDTRPSLLILGGAVGLLLIIACSNVANLLLVHGTGRQSEMALRTALGASRGRLIRQVLTESLCLSMVGGIAGVMLAAGALRAVSLLQPENPMIAESRLEPTVTLAAWLICTAVVLLFALIPAARMAGVDPQLALRQRVRGSQGGHGTQRILVAAQIALSLILLVAAGLLMRSYSRLHAVEPGYRADHLSTFRVSLPAARYRDPESQVRFARALQDRVSRMPGVNDAAITTKLPLTGQPPETSFEWEGMTARQSNAYSADWYAISPNYFDVMGATMVEGRKFTETDDQAHPQVVIVDDALARFAWPGQRAAGKRLRVYSRRSNTMEWYEVVGVVRRLDARELGRDGRPQVYAAFAQEPQEGIRCAARTRGDPGPVLRQMADELAKVDELLPIQEAKLMSEYVSTALGPARFNSFLTGAFAVIAALLAMVGVYGVMAFAVAQRTRELGIRMAIGARGGDVLRMLLGEGARVAAFGIAVGVGGSLLLNRFLASLLYGVTAGDVSTFATAVVMLGGATMGACALPAIRAMRVDPVTALRSE